MIPPYISPDVKSNAEKRIFEWFKNSEKTEDWIVLHSLGISKHVSLIYGEIDFLVLAPKTGIFALEVKGGRVKRQEGEWYYTDKYGTTTKKSRGPFEQAASGIFSIMEVLKKKNSSGSKINTVLYGYGVMFPDIIFEDDSIDINKWQVFDKNDNGNVKDFIKRLSKNYSKQLNNKNNFSPEERLPDNKTIKEIFTYLRGDFDKPISFQLKISEIETTQKKLTNEQFGCLDALEDNPRCLIQGPAGTGKTIIAIEDTVRSLSKNENTVLICFNNLLGDYLKHFFFCNNQYGQPYFTGTFHSFMLKIIKDADIKIDKHNFRSKEFWDTTIPLLFLEAININPVRLDKIIIDESQDLLNDNYIEIFDSILIKGFDRGKWSLFGDFSRQSLYTDLSYELMLEMIERKASFVNYKLRLNCRNTTQICDEIQNITGFSNQNYTKMAANGLPVNYYIWKNDDEQLEKIELLLERLLDKEHVLPETIIILSSRIREESIIAKSRRKILDYSQNSGNCLSFCTIQSYKGLENSIVILTDIDSYTDNKLLYVGLSRARAALYIFESIAAHAERIKLLLKAAGND
jgi:hypothetical protein